MTILTHAPLWVWPLLALLIWVGLRASRPRHVAPIMLYLMPLLGLLALRNVSGLPVALAAWGGFALGYGLGGLLGYLRQGPRILGHGNGRVHLAGEWMTLTAAMVLFCTNFVLGALRSVAPEALGMAAVCAAIALVLGLASGSFAGRALRTWRAVRGGDTARSSSPA